MNHDPLFPIATILHITKRTHLPHHSRLPQSPRGHQLPAATRHHLDPLPPPPGCGSVDPVGLNAAVSACEKGSAWPWALQLLSHGGAAADVVGFAAAVSADGGAWPRAQQLLQSAEAQHLQPDVTRQR